MNYRYTRLNRVFIILRMAGEFTFEDITAELASKISPADARKLLKSLTIPKATVAIETLSSICINPRINPNARVRAAEVLLDRAFGKAEQMEPAPPPESKDTGVMLIPSGTGDLTEWERLAMLHHQKALT